MGRAGSSGGHALGVSKAKEGWRGHGIGEGQESPSVSPTRRWAMGGAPGTEWTPWRHWGASGHPEWPATHTACPAFSQKLLPNSQAARGPPIGLRSGKEKINSLCCKTAALSHSHHNSTFVPHEADDRETNPVHTTVGVLKSSPPEPGEGSPEAGLEQVGTCQRKTIFPQDGQQLALRLGLKPKYMARCPQVGEVEK